MKSILTMFSAAVLLAGCSTMHSTGLPAFCPYDGSFVNDVTSPLDPLPDAHGPPGTTVLHGQCQGFGPVEGEGVHDFFVTNSISKP